MAPAQTPNARAGGRVDWLQVIEKALPAAESALGTASVAARLVGGVRAERRPGRRLEPRLEQDPVAVQAESEIVPVWPLVEVAVALVKRTVPKSVSGRMVVPPGVTAEGASAIHSADDVSGELIRRVFAKLLPVVRLRSFTVTLVPLTLDRGGDVVAGVRPSGRPCTEAAGTSSYQAM